MPFKCVSYVDRFNGERKSDFITNAGSPIKTDYEYQIIDGIKQLVPCGETNTQDMIQSYAEECDINVIVSKFLNGDDSVLHKTVGQFGDFRDCPTTYAEMFDRVLACEKIFNTMPVDIREKFDNSYEKFWSSYGSKYFDDVFSEYNVKTATTSPEVIEKESEVKVDAE